MPVRRMDQITDPVPRAQSRAFIGQEGHHSKEHDTFNDAMRKRGIDKDFYRDDFHPWQHDNRQAVEAAKKQYLGGK